MISTNVQVAAAHALMPTFAFIDAGEGRRD